MNIGLLLRKLRTGSVERTTIQAFSDGRLELRITLPQSQFCEAPSDAVMTSSRH